MAERVVCVSSDCHAAPLPEEYLPYLEHRYQSTYRDWLEEHQRLVGQMTRNRLDRSENDQRDQFSADMKKRLPKLESEGFVAEVIFPNAAFPFSAPPQGFAGPSAYDVDQVQAGIRSYNRWLSENSDRERQIGLFQLPLQDPEYAVREVLSARSLGFRGVMPQFDPWRDKPLDDGCFEEIWSACASERLPVHFHGAFNGVPSGLYSQGTGNSPVFPIEFVFWTTRPLWQLIYAGVLERNPELKLVFAETYADWIPRTLKHLDWRWGHDAHARTREICPELPSEYWKRQCYVAASFASRLEFEMREEIGVSRFMFGTDFPHGPSTWGKSVAYLQHTLLGSGATESEIRAMLGGNAVTLYDLNTNLLGAVAAQVGPTIEELSSPDVRDELPTYLLNQADRPLAV